MAPFSMSVLSCVLSLLIDPSSGDVIRAGSTFIRARNSMPGRRQLTGKITMELRFSGFTSSGEDTRVCPLR